ncbi:MAG: hypothetical protein IKG56_01715 [Clostridia bacterium]|nr:hypothetical protein [Clostridia bacterium]
MYDSNFNIYDEPFSANNYDFSSGSAEAALGTALGGILGALLVFYFVVMAIAGILAIIKYIGMWQMFKKANLDGWEALVPGHNLFVEFQLSGIKTYWYFLLLVPIANIVVLCWKDIELAKAYGKGAGFGIGLFLLGPIFTLILGFGKAQYIGPQANTYSQTNTNNYGGAPNMNPNVNTTQNQTTQSAEPTQPFESKDANNTK